MSEVYLDRVKSAAEAVLKAAAERDQWIKDQRENSKPRFMRLAVKETEEAFNNLLGRWVEVTQAYTLLARAAAHAEGKAADQYDAVAIPPAEETITPLTVIGLATKRAALGHLEAASARSTTILSVMALYVAHAGILTARSIAVQSFAEFDEICERLPGELVKFAMTEAVGPFAGFLEALRSALMREENRPDLALGWHEAQDELSHSWARTAKLLEDVTNVLTQAESQWN